MSTQGDIFGYMQSLKPGAGGVINMTPQELAAATGFARDKVSKTFTNLMTRGRIEVVRDGRNITGFIVKDTSIRPRGRAAHKPTSIGEYQRQQATQGSRIRLISTPALDVYAEAKARFERLTADLGDLVEATFKENAYAEEGLRLRARLEAVEPTLKKLHADLDEANQRLSFLQGRHKADVATRAAEAGAVAKPGD